MTTRETPRQILVVEDDDGFRHLLCEELTDADFAVEAVGSLAEGAELADRMRPAVVLCDLRLPEGTGLDLFDHLRRDADLLQPAFVLITAFGSISQAVEALKKGVDDFLTKPVDFHELVLRLERLLEVQQLKAEVSHYRQTHTTPDFHRMVGQSRAMQELYRRIERIAESDSPVIVSGESGTGKELAARALHANSPRADQPFIPVNCAGVPASLLESEFFGHDSGAFTGADQPREGLFEEADGGTIFLDEITELPQPLQAKLLRALQEEEIRPVGSNRAHPVDVRITAATNRDLDEALADDQMREDLYYRLSTFQLRVPPLRERRDDIARLVSYFLRESSASGPGGVEGMTERALNRLADYAFPGNVRELQNIVERAAVFCEGDMIELGDLPEQCRQAAPSAGDALSSPSSAHTLDVTDETTDSLVEMDALKRRYAHHVLERTDGNKRRAAEILGIGRRTLYRYLDEESAE